MRFIFFVKMLFLPIGGISTAQCLPSRRDLLVLISSAQSDARGGQTPALREKTARVTVGRGPVPRRASIVKETALVCVRFSRRSNDRGKKNGVRYRRARACPSPCLDREGNGLGWWTVFARVGRSRGTGPRATGPEGVRLAMRRSGAGAPELQAPAPL